MDNIKEADNLNKSYGRKVVFKGVSFTLPSKRMISCVFSVTIYS